MLEIALGIFFLAFGLWPGITIYEGRLGKSSGERRGPPIQPQWAARLFLVLMGLAALFDGARTAFFK